MHSCQFADARIEAILDKHPDWSRVKCPECDGRGSATDDDCICTGSGDLLKVRRFNDFGSSWVDDLRAVHWSRGFIERVEARSEEVFYALPVQRGPLNPVVPSPWARVIVAAIPTLREIRVTDKEPENVSPGVYLWHMIGSGEPYDIPRVLFFKGLTQPFLTREAAVAALGRAVCEWVKP